MRTLAKIVALAAIIIGSPSVRADFVVSSTYDGVNYAPVSSFAGYDGSSTVTLASSVSIAGSGSFNLTALTVPLSLADPGVNISQFDLMLVGDSGGNSPNVGNVLWDANLNGGLNGGSGTLSTTAANYTYTLPSLAVTGGQNYWLVLEQTTALTPLGSGNGINLYFATTFAPADQSGFQTVPSSGGLPATVGDAWTVTGLPAAAAAFAYQIQAVPEPGQMAMAGMLLVGAGIYVVRRKLAGAPAEVVS